MKTLVQDRRKVRVGVLVGRQRGHVGGLDATEFNGPAAAVGAISRHAVADHHRLCVRLILLERMEFCGWLGMTDQQFLLIAVVDGNRDLPRIEPRPDLFAQQVCDVVQFANPRNVDLPQLPVGITALDALRQSARPVMATTTRVAANHRKTRMVGRDTTAITRSSLACRGQQFDRFAHQRPPESQWTVRAVCGM